MTTFSDTALETRPTHQEVHVTLPLPAVNARYLESLQPLASALCFASLVVGALVLVSWVADLPIISTYLDGSVRAKPQTGAAIVLLAIANWTLCASRRSGIPRPRVVTVLTASIMPLCALELARPAWWRHTLDLMGTSSMSYLAAAQLLGLGSAILLAAWSERAWPVHLLAAAGALAGVVGLSGYIFDFESFQRTRAFSDTSLPTVVGLLGLSGTLFTLQPARGLTGIFISESSGGILLRRLLLPVVAIPVAINAMVLLGVEAGWYPERTGWIIDVGLVMSMLGVISVLAAWHLHEVDRERLHLSGALRESEERYRALVEASPDAIIVKNRKRIEYANAAAFQLVGASAEEAMIGRSPYAFVHPEERTVLERRVCDILEHGGHLPATEHRVLRLDGGVVDVEVTGGRVSLGGVPLAQLVARDVSRRKQDERALRDSEERFRLIANTISDVFWISTATFDRLLYVSPAFERVWGRSRAGLDRGADGLVEAIHRDDRGRFGLVRQHMAAGDPFVVEFRVGEAEHRARWVRARGFPVRNNDGGVARYVGVMEEITEAKLAEQALRRAAERFELVTRATRDAIWDLNPYTDAMWWSDWMYDHFGFERGMAPTLARRLERIHGDHQERVSKGFERAIRRQESTYAVEYAHLFSNGEYGPVLERVYIMYDDTGKPSRIVGALVDLTEQRALEQQLVQAQKMEAIGALAGGIAHDFNNVLTGIIGFAELSLLSLDNRPTAIVEEEREGLHEILKAAGRAASLTRQLLAFSRGQILAPQVVELDDLLRDVEKLLRRLLREDIELRLLAEASGGVIKVDATQFQQIVVNLTVNAADAMPNGGVLTLHSEVVRVEADGAIMAVPAALPRGQYVRLAVADTGTGIPAAIQHRIFEPFFTTKAPGKGTGLGLSTVYGIVRQSTAYLSLISEEGEGTTFNLYFPVSERAEPEQPLAAELPRPAVDGGETILVSEDDPAIRRLIDRSLSRLGYKVLVAQDGTEAVEMAAAHDGQIHLLITDVVMPRQGGVAVAERVRQERGGIRVLYVSGYSNEVTLMAGVAQGESFLAKPFTPTDLLAKVRDMLQRQ